MPATKLVPTPLERERGNYEVFVRNDTAPEYREILAHMYAHWYHVTQTYFEGKGLIAPHFEIGPTHARRFSEARLTTGYGGTMSICLSERIAFPEGNRLIRSPWPSLGVTRLINDLVTGETVKQYVMEVLGDTEEVYGGRGRLFSQEASRIGPLIGLPEGDVRYRRRGPYGHGESVAASWPWGFRTEGYYFDDVRLSHLKVGGNVTRPPRNLQVAPGVCDYLIHLAQINNNDRLIEVLGHQKNAETITQHPSVAAFERSPSDESGKTLPTPVIDPNWLTWHNGCVRQMVDGILKRRLFDGMPILADALQDAGCEDKVLLDHCRSHTAHTSKCWALAMLSGS